MTLPLAGLRVLDLSRALPGPFCTQVLADYGAEIIKIEDLTGDPSRSTDPRIAGESARFFAVNRNKRSITLDLRRDEGKEIFKRLVEGADVVVDVFRPGIMDRLGLGYEVLKKINQGIIYCSLNGFGNTGPLRNAPVHDINITSLAGITDLTGRSSGPPAMSAVQIGGVSGALYSLIAILMALQHRNKTGMGQFCDIAMLDTSISFLAYTLAEWSGTGSIPKRGEGLLTGHYAYFNIYETKDNKYISLGASEMKFWKRFCTEIGRPEYISIHKNLDRQEEMVQGIQLAIKQKSQQEWMEIFGNEICLTPVLNLQEVSDHPQVENREMIVKMRNFKGSDQDLAVIGLPFKLSDSPGEIKLEFPSLGEHKRQILEEAGYTADQIQEFIDKKII